MTEKRTTNHQRSATEIANERIRTAETARDDGHALSQFAVDNLVLCGAFLKALTEVEDLKKQIADIAAGYAIERATIEAARNLSCEDFIPGAADCGHCAACVQRKALLERLK